MSVQPADLLALQRDDVVDVIRPANSKRQELRHPVSRSDQLLICPLRSSNGAAFLSCRSRGKFPVPVACVPCSAVFQMHVFVLRIPAPSKGRVLVFVVGMPLLVSGKTTNLAPSLTRTRSLVPDVEVIRSLWCFAGGTGLSHYADTQATPLSNTGHTTAPPPVSAPR